MTLLMRAIPTLRICLAIAVLIMARPASAQVAYHLSLNPGTQVRIETREQPGRKITGEVYSTVRDTLFLQGDRGYAVSDLKSLRLRSGVDRKRGILIGAAIGGVAGFFEGTEERGSVTAGTAMIGMLFGYAFAPKGWEKIPLPDRR